MQDLNFTTLLVLNIRNLTFVTRLQNLLLIQGSSILLLTNTNFIYNQITAYHLTINKTWVNYNELLKLTII